MVPIHSITWELYIQSQIKNAIYLSKWNLGALWYTSLFFTVLSFQISLPVVYSIANRWLGLRKIEAGWSLLTYYGYFSYLVAIFEDFLSLDFLYENWNSVRGPIFEISKGILNMLPRLYINNFSIFCHSFWCTITFQTNLEINYFRSYPTVHCASNNWPN